MATVDYDLHLLKVYDKHQLGGGKITKTVLSRSQWVGSPLENAEQIVVQWSGVVAATGATFQRPTRFTFKAGEAFPLQPPRGAHGRRMPHFPGRVMQEAVVGRMGEGEEVELAVDPDFAYGEAGAPEKGVAPNAHLTLRLKLVSWVVADDVSPAKDGTAIKRTYESTQPNPSTSLP